MVLKNKKQISSSFLINEKIPFPSILLLTETEKKVVSKQEALQKAQETNLSLLCVAPQANPPVCKLVDYQ
jgi:translation initiation factor IF-3